MIAMQCYGWLLLRLIGEVTLEFIRQCLQVVAGIVCAVGVFLIKVKIVKYVR
jgi:hypothetical protein